MGRDRASLVESFETLLGRLFGRQRGLASIRKLPWPHFETLVGEAFRRRGYSIVANAAGAAGGGIDVVLRKGSGQFFVQCKHRKVLKVGVKPVRQLFGAIVVRNASGGFFVSAGTYTTEARAFARESGIELIDGPALQQMVFEAQSPEPFMDPTVGRRRTNTSFTP